MSFSKAIDARKQTYNGLVPYEIWNKKYVTDLQNTKVGTGTVITMNGDAIPTNDAAIIIKPKYSTVIAGERKLLDVDISGYINYSDFIIARAEMVKNNSYFKSNRICVIPLGKYVRNNAEVKDVFISTTWEASETLTYLGEDGQRQSIGTRLFVDICTARSCIFKIATLYQFKGDKLKECEKLCNVLYHLIQTMRSLYMNSKEYKAKVDEIVISIEHSDVLRKFVCSLVVAELDASTNAIIIALRRMMFRHLKFATKKRIKKTDAYETFNLADISYKINLSVVMILAFFDIQFTDVAETHNNVAKRIIEKLPSTYVFISKIRKHIDENKIQKFKPYNALILTEILRGTILAEELLIDEFSGVLINEKDYDRVHKEKIVHTSFEGIHKNALVFFHDVLYTEKKLTEIVKRYSGESLIALPKYLKDNIACINKVKFKTPIINKVGDTYSIHPSNEHGAALVFDTSEIKDSDEIKLIISNITPLGYNRETKGDTRGKNSAYIRIGTGLNVNKSPEAISTTGVSLCSVEGEKKYDESNPLTIDKDITIIIKRNKLEVKQKHGAMTSSWTPEIMEKDYVFLYINHVLFSMKINTI